MFYNKENTCFLFLSKFINLKDIYLLKKMYGELAPPKIFKAYSL